MTRIVLAALCLLAVTYCTVDEQRTRAKVQIACIESGGTWKAIRWGGPTCVQP
jgi:hypothetical protein